MHSQTKISSFDTQQKVGKSKLDKTQNQNLLYKESPNSRMKKKKKTTYYFSACCITNAPLVSNAQCNNKATITSVSALESYFQGTQNGMAKKKKIPINKVIT